MKVTAGGRTIELGTTEANPTIGIIDFSRRVTDDFGVTTVVRRGFARRMSVSLVVPSDQADSVQQALAELRATPARWTADDRFAWLDFDGFYKDFDLDLALPPVSHCTLTVEGLTETEVIADPGGDPAPDGQPSTLLMVQPVTVDDGVLVASNVLENDYPEWSAAATYGAGIRVIKASTHRIYESAVWNNQGNDPEEPNGLWIDVGPTNRWAMFDQALGSATSRLGSIVVTLDAGAIDAVALLDVVGETVRVQAPGYDRTQPVGPGAITFLDLPGAAGQVSVTVASDGEAAVGTLLVGHLTTLGMTERNPTAAIDDFSRKETDEFGEPVIVERAWSKRMSARAKIRTDAVDIVANRIAAVRARPTLWIGDEGTDSLTVYGFFRDFSIEVGQTLGTLSLQIEGLSKAPPLAPPTPFPPPNWTDIIDDDPVNRPRPQDGADVTGENTARDTANVGGKPAGQVISELEQLDQDMTDAEARIAEHQQQITELVATYGHTEAAAVSAAVASQAAQNAETARQQAQASRVAAEQAEADALAQAQAAGGSASAAAGHASTALSAADEAAGRATAAAGSATLAATKAGEASVSAGQAATSATNAEGSASSASTSAALAAVARDDAEDAATAASNSASSAAASNTSAGQHASAAQTAATNASTSAGQASTSATQASTSASNAAGSASVASTAATNAASYRDQAQGSASAAASSASTAGTYRDQAGNFSSAAASSASLAATYENNSRLSLAATFPEALNGDIINNIGGGGPPSAQATINGTNPSWMVDNGSTYFPPAAQYNVGHVDVLRMVPGEIYELVATVEAVEGASRALLWSRVLADDYSLLTDLSLGTGGGFVELESGQSFTLRRMVGRGVTAPGVTNLTTANAAFLRPMVLINRGPGSNGGNPAVRTKVRSFFAINVTAREGAAAQASVATAQATAASGSASSASTSATTAATYRDQAQGHANSASSSASTASSAASVATAQASAAQQSATLAASIGQGTLNINPVFADYPNATGVPAGYTVFGTPAHTTRLAVTDGPSPYAVVQGVTAATNAGLLQLNPAGSQLYNVRPGWFVLEADFMLTGGSLSGAGLYLPGYSSAGTLLDSSIRISFSQELGTFSPGLNSMIRIRKVVQIAHAELGRVYLYGMSGWTSLPGNEAVTAKTMRWYRLGVRPANQGEIEAMRVAPLEATVTQQGQVLATQEGTLASLTSTVNSQGLTVSQVQQSVDGMAGRWGVAIDANGRVVGRVRLDGNQTTSRFVVSTNAFEVENPGGGDGLSWTTDANGRGTIRIRSGTVNVVELGWAP